MHPDTIVTLRRAIASPEMKVFNPFRVYVHPNRDARSDDPEHPNHQRVLGVVHETTMGIIMDLEVVDVDEAFKVRSQ